MTQAIIVEKIEKMEAEIERLSTLEFVQRADSQTAWARQNAIFLGLPFLRAYWPHAAYQSGNIITDLAGKGMHLTMNFGTRPLMTLGGVNNQAPGCFYLSASSNFALKTNDAQLNITGGETDIDSTYRGLTIGAWVNPITITGTRPVAGKWKVTLNQRQYLLSVTSSRARFEVSSNGTAITSVVSASTLTASSWYLLIGRFDPSAEVSILANGVEAVNTTSIPSLVNSDTGSFEVGSHDTSVRPYLNATVGPVFLCAGLLNDAVCDNLLETTRGLYGV